MKKKDTMYLVISVALFALVGLIIYSQLGSKKAAAGGGPTAEIITPIQSNFDQNAIGALQDPTVTQNFSVPIDITGLGNAQPFGPLK